MSKTEYVTVSAFVLKLTEKAALLSIDDAGKDVERWVPLSTIENGDDLVEDGDETVDVHIAKWFCDKEGIE